MFSVSRHHRRHWLVVFSQSDSVCPAVQLWASEELQLLWLSGTLCSLSVLATLVLLLLLPQNCKAEILLLRQCTRRMPYHRHHCCCLLDELDQLAGFLLCLCFTLMADHYAANLLLSLSPLHAPLHCFAGGLSHCLISILFCSSSAFAVALCAPFHHHHHHHRHRVMCHLPNGSLSLFLSPSL